jgi:hypothetical protein
VVGAVDTAVYAFILYLYFAPQRGYTFTVNALLSVTFVLGVVLLVTVGPFGAGELWLFAFPVLAGVLSGVTAAVVALGLNLVTLLAIAFSLGRLAQVATVWTERTTAGWLVVTLNFMLLDAAITLVLTSLVSRLDNALAGVQESTGKLDAERRELLHANERLRQEIERSRTARPPSSATRSWRSSSCTLRSWKRSGVSPAASRTTSTTCSPRSSDTRTSSIRSCAARRRFARS